jgi:hypothetical protein
MSRHVYEIMNRELFAVRPDERVSLTRETILALGSSTVPARRPRALPRAVTRVREGA